MKLEIGKRYVLSTRTTRMMVITIYTKKDLRFYQRMQKEIEVSFEPI